MRFREVQSVTALCGVVKARGPAVALESIDRCGVVETYGSVAALGSIARRGVVDTCCG